MGINYEHITLEMIGDYRRLAQSREWGLRLGETVRSGMTVKKDQRFQKGYLAGLPWLVLTCRTAQPHPKCEPGY